MLNIKTIQLRTYNTMEVIGDEVDALNSFAEYEPNCFIDEVIADILDVYIPLEKHHIYKHAVEISYWSDKALEEGYCSNASNLERVLQYGYYLYYQDLLNKNLNAILFNYIACKLNDSIVSNSLELDTIKLSNAIDDALKNIDGDTLLNELDEIADSLL